MIPVKITQFPDGTYIQAADLKAALEGIACQLLHSIVVVAALVPVNGELRGLRAKVVHDGVQDVVVRRVWSREDDALHREGGGFLSLPVAEEWAVTNQDDELLDATVLETEKSLLEVPVVN